MSNLLRAIVKLAREGFEPPSMDGRPCGEDIGGSHYWLRHL